MRNMLPSALAAMPSTSEVPLGAGGSRGTAPAEPPDLLRLRRGPLGRLRLLVHRDGGRDELHGPAGLLDRGAGAGRDAVHLQGDRALELALAEDDDAVPVAADEARRLEGGRIDHAGEPVEVADLDLLEVAAVVVDEAELRE